MGFRQNVMGVVRVSLHHFVKPLLVFVRWRRVGHRPQSSSSSRFTAGASGFFIVSQSGERARAKLGAAIGGFTTAATSAAVARPRCASMNAKGSARQFSGLVLRNRAAQGVEQVVVEHHVLFTGR
jgi:hypothetical protein